MAMAFARVLLLADTHLGFDDPERPRVVRRRRGPDFFARFEEALEPALRGDVDLVVHGGDVFHRSRVSANLVQRDMAPLLRVADRGVPVFLVPGNHERARISYPLLTRHPGVHVFHEPRTVVVTRGGVRIAVAGFPFRRVVDAAAFPRLVAATGGHDDRADVRLLAMHQAVEGATVGAHDFTFRRGRDVVPGAAIPHGFAAVLSGHIHRAQALDRDLEGRPLAAPVLYPGSIERTAFAERGETKGYALLRVEGGPGGGHVVARRFVPLPARPMRLVEIHVAGLCPAALAASLRRSFEGVERDAVVRVITVGEPAPGAERVLCAAGLRDLAPATMNVDLAPPPRLGNGIELRGRRRAAHRPRPA
jgi:DNA repair exonuclease SbcCD nuclease subunit